MQGINAFAVFFEQLFACGFRINLIDFRINAFDAAAHGRFYKGIINDFCSVVQLHNAREAKPVNLRVKRTDAVRQLPRQHRNDCTRGINRGGTFVSFIIQRGALCHIMAYVSNMDTQSIATLGTNQRNCIVDVLCISAIYRENRPVTQIASTAQILCRHLCVFIFLRFCLYLCRERLHDSM